MQNLLAYGNTMLAETINLKPTGGLAGSLTGLTINSIVGGGLKLILIVAALAFFFILVMGGVNWIISGGDKAKTEGARNQITAALVGLVIFFSAWAIAQLLASFFGIEIFNLTIDPIQ